MNLVVKGSKKIVVVLLIQLRSFLPTGFFCGGVGMLIQGTFGGLHCPAAVCFSLLLFSNRVTLSIHPIHVGSLVLRGEGFIHRRAPGTLLPLSLPFLVSLKSCTWDDALEDAPSSSGVGQSSSCRIPSHCYFLSSSRDMARLAMESSCWPRI